MISLMVWFGFNFNNMGTAKGPSPTPSQAKSQDSSPKYRHVRAHVAIRNVLSMGKTTDFSLISYTEMANLFKMKPSKKFSLKQKVAMENLNLSN